MKMAFREVNRETVAIPNIVMNGTVNTWGIIMKYIFVRFSRSAVVVSWPVGDSYWPVLTGSTVPYNRRSQESWINRGVRKIDIWFLSTLSILSVNSSNTPVDLKTRGKSSPLTSFSRTAILLVTADRKHGGSGNKIGPVFKRWRSHSHKVGKLHSFG